MFEVVRANALAIQQLIPVDLRKLVQVSETESNTMLLEWEARKGFVALEVGAQSYHITYVPDDIDGTQWATSGHMSQIDTLAKKLSGTGILPAHDKLRVKLATVILFKPNGRYYTEESWAVPEGAIGPWDMKNSIHFRRIDGGPILVETQEPWGFPHLI